MRDDLLDKLVPAVADVPWGGVTPAVDSKIRELRTLADFSSGITALAAVIFRKKPKGAGPLSRAIQQWDTASDIQRKNTILAAWRRANPAWAYHPSHDPFPRGKPT